MKKVSTSLTLLQAAALTSILSTLVACQGSESPDVAANAEASAPAAQEAAATPSTEPIASDANASATGVQDTGMEKKCGSTTFRISRSAQDDQNRTTLERSGEDGHAVVVEKPVEMADYTAVGLGCATAADNTSYAVVQYGELPYGCQFCEWFYLYDMEGKQLTKSNPPILVDASLPEGEQQSSNTREYQEMIQKLGITHPEVEYIE